MAVHHHQPTLHGAVGPGFVERHRRAGAVLVLFFLVSLGVLIGAAVGTALAEALTLVLSHVKTEI